MGKEGIEYNIRSTRHLRTINAFGDHFGGVRMKVIRCVLAQYQSVSPGAKIRFEVLYRLAALFIG